MLFDIVGHLLGDKTREVTHIPVKINLLQKQCSISHQGDHGRS